MFGWSLPVIAVALLVPQPRAVDSDRERAQTVLSQHLLDPVLVARIGRDLAKSDPAPQERALLLVTHQDDTVAAPGAGYIAYSVPPLLRYTQGAGDVSLSLSPGSPCTAACVKLQGSF